MSPAAGRNEGGAVSPSSASRRIWVWALGGLALSVLLVLVTKWTGFGERIWHYNVSFVLSTIAYVALWRPLTRNRTWVGIPLLVTAVLAIVSGFYLLYAKQYLKDTGWKDVAKYWHSITSWWLLLVTIGHFMLNWAALKRYFLQVYHRVGTGTLFTVVWLVVVGVIVYTVGPVTKTWFRDENYLWLSSLSILLSSAIGYGLWVAWKWRTGAWGTQPSGAIANRRTRNGIDRPFVRRHLDLHMFGWYWLAQVSGLVLLYFKDFLHGNGFKYVSKFWHTAPSAVVTVMMFTHTVMSWPLIVAYWRRWRRALGDSAKRERAVADTDDLPPITDHM